MPRPNQKGGYLTVWKNGKFSSKHRVVYEEYFGKIPDGFRVHHKNGDPTDNRIENLELLTQREHSRRHSKNYHLSESGEWLKKCHTCHKIKSLSEFYSMNKTTHRRDCKSCCKEIAKHQPLPRHPRFVRVSKPKIKSVIKRKTDIFIDQALAMETNDCIIWPYARIKGGYASITRDKQSSLVTRIICERIYGKPPTSKYEAAHNCGNPPCVNKHHLRWDTRGGNMADTIPHGTSTRGERSGRAKLTEADVQAIRAKAGTATHRAIAKESGVDTSQVTLIINRKSWAWLP